MNTKTRNTIFILIVVLLLITGAIISIFSNRIPSNSPDTVGNLPGNVNNGGLFCELKDKVYFSNAYDNGALYSMNPDGSDMKRLNSNNCYSIVGAGNYLYYCMSTKTDGEGLGFLLGTNGIYRSKTNGHDMKSLASDVGLGIQLCGNYLYCQVDSDHGTVLTKIKTDKSERDLVADFVVNPASIDDQIMYYNGVLGDHYLYTYDTRNGVTSTLWEGNLWNPIYQDGYIYYMDVSDNYCLCRYNTYEGTVDKLTSDRIDCYNVYQDVIFYSKNDAVFPALMRMNTNGSGLEKVMDGSFTNINITSTYTYFTEFNTTIPVYKTPTFSGGSNVSVFAEASTAAIENLKR